MPRREFAALSIAREHYLQNFMQNFSYTKSFAFRDSDCTIELQVSIAALPTLLRELTVAVPIRHAQAITGWYY